MKTLTKRSERGTAILFTLVVMVILTSMAAMTLFRLQQRYRTSFQTAAWQEAGMAADAGVDKFVAFIRAKLFEEGGAFVPPTTGTFYSDTYTLNSEGGRKAWFEYQFDVPPGLENTTNPELSWYRVRSWGFCEVSGGTVVSDYDKLRGGSTVLTRKQAKLRKFDFINDHRTNLPIASGTTDNSVPRAWRKIEAIVRPVTVFDLALFAVSEMDFKGNNVLVDSFDSTDPDKSNGNGLYPAGNAGDAAANPGELHANDTDKLHENGDIATNGPVIGIGNSDIYGDASTNSPTDDGSSVQIAENGLVTGEINEDFYMDAPIPEDPELTADTGTPNTATSSGTFYAKPSTADTYGASYVVNEIDLSGSETIHITRDPGTPTAANGGPAMVYISVQVTGNFSISGNAAINIDPDVSVRFYVQGDSSIGGNGLQNSSQKATQLQVYGYDDGSGTTPQGSFTYSGNAAFYGAVYAPNHDVVFNGGGNSDIDLYGSFVGWTITMNGHTSVHYDEALQDSGLISNYKVVSWFEDTMDQTFAAEEEEENNGG